MGKEEGCDALDASTKNKFPINPFRSQLLNKTPNTNCMFIIQFTQNNPTITGWRVYFHNCKKREVTLELMHFPYTIKMMTDEFCIVLQLMTFQMSLNLIFYS